MATSCELLVVYWEWTEGTAHSGHRFWASHSMENDGRLQDWPKQGLRPIGAAKVLFTEGVGLELLHELQNAAGASTA